MFNLQAQLDERLAKLKKAQGKSGAPRKQVVGSAQIRATLQKGGIIAKPKKKKALKSA